MIIIELFIKNLLLLTTILSDDGSFTPSLLPSQSHNIVFCSSRVAFTSLPYTSSFPCFYWNLPTSFLTQEQDQALENTNQIIFSVKFLQCFPIITHRIKYQLLSMATRPRTPTTFSSLPLSNHQSVTILARLLFLKHSKYVPLLSMPFCQTFPRKVT